MSVERFHDEEDGQNNVEDNDIVAEIIESRAESRKKKRKFLIAAVCLLVAIIIGVAAIKSRSKTSPSPAPLTSDGGGKETASNPSATGGNPSHHNPSNDKEDDYEKDDYAEGYNCKHQRLDNANMKHNKKLQTGEYICSHNKHRYSFGMTADGGDLVWRDNKKDKTKKYYDGKVGDYFMLSINGTITVLDKHDKVKWKKEPIKQFPVVFSEKCIEDHDCPFLHLQTDGTLIVSWKDEGTGEMVEKNFEHVLGL